MNDFVKRLLANDKIRYLIAGGCTTLVNFQTFLTLRYFMVSRNIANVIAVSTAIAFAYFANKYFVFRSRSESLGRLFIEVVSFVGARLVSMAVEVVGLSLLCDSFRMKEVPAKIAVQIAVVVINYLCSKIFVFNGDKRGLRERLVKNRSWLIAGFITFIFMYGVIVVGKVEPFGDRSLTVVDSLHQYLPFFSDYQDKLKNEGNMFYTWDIGLGVNFMSLFMYYLASPLNIIIILYDMMDLPAVMSAIAAIKISISAMTFGYYLSRKGNRVKNNWYITAFSVAYALSNYVTGYYWNIMWMDCIMIFPLVILGFERMMEKRDIKLYCLSLFYCMYCNYYIAFMICLFLVLWFLAYAHKPKKLSVKTERAEGTDSAEVRVKAGTRVKAWAAGFFMDGFTFAGASLISGGMAAFSLLASYMAIMTTASADERFPEHSWYGNIFDILKQHLFLTEPIKNQTFDGGANLYCGVFAILLLFIYIFAEKINIVERIRKIALIIILVLSFNSTVLNFIWHGFHNQYGIPNRFAFVYVFVLLYIAYEVSGRIKLVHPAYIVSGLFLTIAFFLMCRYEAGNFEDSTKLILLSSVIAVLYATMFIIRKKGIAKRSIVSRVTAILFIIEIVVNAAFGYVSNGNANAGYYMQNVEKIQRIKPSADDHADDHGYAFYREELADPVMLDEATLNNMKSVGTFCSTVRGETVKAMSELGFYTAANEYLYMGATPVTASMLAVRYLYVREDDYFSDEDTMEAVVFNSEDTVVYENEYQLPLAFGVKSSIYDWDINEGTASECINNLARCAGGIECDIFTETDIAEMYLSSSSGCALEYSSDNRQISYTGAVGDSLDITLSFTVDRDGDYYMNMRGNYMKNMTYYINGEYLASGRYHQQMFHVGKLYAGDTVKIEIEFNSGFSQSGTLTANLSSFDIDEFEKLHDELVEYPLVISSWDDGYIEGRMKLDTAMTLFTSIPYDDGWRVYVDGERVENKKTGEAFLAVDLKRGYHYIEMIYYPPGLFLGMGISVASWCLFCIIIIKKRRNEQL